MSLIGSFLDGLDNIVMWTDSKLKKNLYDYCELETALNDHTLVAVDGSLVSIVRIDGVKSLIGNANFFRNIVDPLEGKLASSLGTKAHMIQFFFVQDPDRTEKELRHFLRSSFTTMSLLNLDMQDMLEERIKSLKAWTNYEACYMALWTRPYDLSKTDRDIEKKRKINQFSKVNTPTSRSQKPFAANSMIIDRHVSFVDTTVSDFRSNFVATKVLKVHDACREIRATVDPDWTDPSWKPVLPGDRVYPELRKGFLNAEEWDIVWPRLNQQLTPRDTEVIGNNMVQLGRKIYAPVYINLFPRDPSPFIELFHRLMNKNMPWRVSFLIEGDGLGNLGMKKLMASLLGWTNGDNNLIKEAVDKLEELKKNASTIVKIRAAFCTWAKAGDVDELSKRVSDLARAIEGWGTCDVAEVSGDPQDGIFSSALGFRSTSVGTAAAAPLKEALYMMPLARPSSPWEEGAITFRSPDGKILPYQPGSKKQATWINFIFAKPGSGKSLLMNMSNLALCLSPGLERLPKIAIIDIGPSSEGLISLIRESLPYDKRHLVAHYRMKMTTEYAVNPFDTQLGCRFPTSLERQFLINFVTLLATEISSEVPIDGMPGLVTAVIDEMYKQKADRGRPNLYVKGIEPEVDAAVEQLALHLDKKTTWWEVVDSLFESGEDYAHAAMLAQRYAVPVLSEASTCAQDERIKNTYGEMRLRTSETLILGFNRMIADALQFYPVLSKPTAFDIGSARVVALDLDEVAKTGGPVADRQTAVMYMLGRYVLAKDFYITENALNEMPYPPHIEMPSTVPAQKYKKYHAERIEQLRGDLKRICFDEFHRTSKAQIVRDQILVDMREGRKWRVDVTLSSQALEDFDSTMLQFATGIFIMNGGNAEAIENIAKTFALSDPAEKAALQYGVHPPRKGGGTFLAKFETEDGWYTMLLTSTLGPIELWALTTTAEDVSIRNKLYSRIGPKNARKVLGIRYPHGSARDDINARKNNLKNQGFIVDKDATNIVGQIVEELVELKKALESKGQL